jgi:ferrochelatase
MQWAPLSRMLASMNEASPIDPVTATTATDVTTAPAAAIGVLLVNLGTPDAADAPAVRRYLKEFLSDPRVIENQGLVWQAVLNGIILPIRPRIKAKDYQKIWNVERNESPLKTITRAQAEKLGAALAPLGAHLIVDWAMRYGNPSIEQRLAGLIARGCERILIMPLYPQYSAATTATVCDEVFRVLMGLRRQPTVRVAAPYYDDKVYIDALAASMRDALGKLAFQPEVILASYHGMPEEYVRKGDPYEKQCIETTRLLRAALGMSEEKLMLTFQSRFGRAKWLEPATDHTVKALAKRGVKSLAVVTPGFSADCLETLEEIAVENAHIFRKAGGENFAAIPCLNDSAPGMLMLEDMARRELKGWV